MKIAVCTLALALAATGATDVLAQQGIAPAKASLSLSRGLAVNHNSVGNRSSAVNQNSAGNHSLAGNRSSGISPRVTPALNRRRVPSSDRVPIMDMDRLLRRAIRPSRITAVRTMAADISTPISRSTNGNSRTSTSIRVNGTIGRRSSNISISQNGRSRSTRTMMTTTTTAGRTDRARRLFRFVCRP